MIYNTELFAEFFEKTLIICDLNNAAVSEISTRISTHLTKLKTYGLTSDYDTATPTKQESAYNTIFDADYELLDDYISAMNTVINTPDTTTEPEPAYPSYGSSGSSGSGGGTSISVTTPSNPVKTDNKAEFTDVPADFWGYEHIKRLANKGIINGKGNGIFDPNGIITREEYLKMIILASGITPNGEHSAFTDVCPNQWYYPYVALAEKLGIANGIDGGAFGIGNSITRQDAATLMYRCLIEIKCMQQKNEELKFADSYAIAPYAKDAVAYLTELGIIDGMGDNKFVPNEFMTRAMVAKMIDVMMQQ